MECFRFKMSTVGGGAKPILHYQSFIKYQGCENTRELPRNDSQGCVGPIKGPRSFQVCRCYEVNFKYFGEPCFQETCITGKIIAAMPKSQKLTSMNAFSIEYSVKTSIRFPPMIQEKTVSFRWNHIMSSSIISKLVSSFFIGIGEY